MLTVGETAPDFKITTLGEEGPKHITLSENLGKPTVLLFVPMAFTSVCTKALCSVTGEMSEYESLDAKIIAISGDSPFAQAAWAEKEGIKLTLASDYEHDVAKEYGVAYESFLPEKNLTMGGVPKRSAFVIDANGIIQYAESSDDPAKVPSFEDIKAKLVELKN